MKSEAIVHHINLVDFMKNYYDLCIYDIGPINNNIEIIEYAPTLFSEIRRKFGVSDDLLF